MKCKSRALQAVSVALMAGAMAMVPGMTVRAQDKAAQEPSEEAKWYLAVSPGLADFEGDQVVGDGFMLGVLVGYDVSYRWSIEGGLNLAPSLASHSVSAYEPDWSSTYAAGLVLDGIFHTRPFDRFDLHLAAGLGYMHYGEDPSVADETEDAPSGDQDDLQLRVGGGMTYNINDMWAVRTDFRTMLVGFGGDPNANSFINAGVIWHWGANVPPNWIAVDGTKDSDGDGLTDVDEVNKYRTDPYDPDTDKDDLTDGEEVLKYRTDPLNPDTDMDLLKDGEEVKVQLTDPKDPDTDDGGVIDGHEVLEDFTNPRAGHGNDDLVLYTLYIDFDTDKADLKPKFHPPIDIIGKELARNPTWTARIEGHADQRRKSLPDYNVKLSDRRAASVLDYLTTAHKVDRARMKSKGYGYSRPKVKNNPDAVDGTPENRRVEVYVRKGPEPTGPLAVVPDKVEDKAVNKAVVEKQGATPAAKPADKKDVAAGMVPVTAPVTAPVAAPVGPQSEDK